MMGAGVQHHQSLSILDRFYDAGGNFIDTANAYDEGRSEETIGAYFQQRKGRRDRMVVATKFGGTLYPDDPNGGGSGRKAIRAQLEESLHRLHTDYVDLYWMHQWDARQRGSKKRSPLSMTGAGREDPRDWGLQRASVGVNSPLLRSQSSADGKASRRSRSSTRCLHGRPREAFLLSSENLASASPRGGRSAPESSPANTRAQGVPSKDRGVPVSSHPG